MHGSVGVVPLTRLALPLHRPDPLPGDPVRRVQDGLDPSHPGNPVALDARRRRRPFPRRPCGLAVPRPDAGAHHGKTGGVQSGDEPQVSARGGVESGGDRDGGGRASRARQAPPPESEPTASKYQVFVFITFPQ